MAHLFSPLARAAAAVALLAALTQPVSADPMTLQDLLNGGSITVGDRTGSNVGNFSSIAQYGGATVDPSKVFIIPTVTSSGVGLTFRGGAQFRVGPNKDQDTRFTFTVTSTDPNDPIPGGNVGFGARATGGSTVSLTAGVVGKPNAMLLASNSNGSLSTGFLALPQPSLDMAVDIHLHGGPGPLAFAFLRNFQIISEAPEPASLTLFGLGGLGLIAYRWRRRAA
jgi:hypothetical protein